MQGGEKVDLHPTSPGETEAGGRSTLNQLSFPLHNMQYFPSNAKVLLLFLFQPWHGGAGTRTAAQVLYSLALSFVSPPVLSLQSPRGDGAALPQGTET